MIGWQVGWIVAPDWLIPDLVAVSLDNVVVPVGIAQNAATLALERSPESLPAYVAELQRRARRLGRIAQPVRPRIGSKPYFRADQFDGGRPV